MKRKILAWLVYPMTMGVAVATYLFLLTTQVNFLVATYVPLTIAGLSVTFFEYYIPYKTDWKGSGNDVKHDMLFMVFIQLIFTKFLAFFAALVILKALSEFQIPLKSFWPGNLPVLVQGILMVLIIDFFRYWLHRASHNTKLLWRLHAVHHSPKKLYWLNVGRFHPIERSLQFMIDSFPFLLLGVKEEALAMYFLFFSVNGFFQHCNIYLKYGFLNYVVSSAELHRWHHSREISESNNNYSNTTIIWDIIFGTWFLPKNKEVGELGLVNRNYPLGFGDQMKTPFLSNLDKKDLPLISFKQIVLNLVLDLRMIIIGVTLFYPLRRNAKNPLKFQQQLLDKIIKQNQNTTFGKRFNFGAINSYEQFKINVPVQSYEDLRPYIENQEKLKTPELNSEMPMMYNMTSGTTGLPKFIPILKSALKNIKVNQKLFSYIQYKTTPEGFYGKLLGLVSPAVEGFLPSGSAFGSASGLIYKHMPAVARSKYVVPYEVFEIPDYFVKYYVTMAFALSEKNITYLGSANPSTFLKMQNILVNHGIELITDIQTGRLGHLENVESELARNIKEAFLPNPLRAAELSDLFHNNEILFKHVWPYLKIVTTWTGGSCGVALSKIRTSLPNDVKIFELGYLSSEVRGTITVDGFNNGVPTFQSNFFEFVEKEKWENNEFDFLTLDKIKQGAEYYIFVTTESGLYRYHMNDIVSVTGLFEQTPTIKFIQKGKGVTNLTGEKLYESQVLNTIAKLEERYGFQTTFYQMLGDEDTLSYSLYLESTLAFADQIRLQEEIDGCLREINIEYQSKRAGGRLKPLKLFLLKAGTYEQFKILALSKGQREGQFKTITLLLKKDASFDFDDHVITA